MPAKGTKTHGSETTGSERLYARCEQILRRSIRSGLPPGTVLLEAQLAKLLGSSRAPVRQALAHLHEEGLVQRSQGRGYLVGRNGHGIPRVKLSVAMLGLDEPGEALRRSLAWEGIYEDVERSIIHRSVFGSARVNEVELASRYGVGRSVARDVLTRLQSLGMLAKDERQRWIIVSLDRQRLASLYELRQLLEPAALRHAMQYAEVALLEEMRRRLQVRRAAYPKVSANDMNDLEYDLHVRLLSLCRNRELLGALQRTRCTLTLSKHVLGVEMPLPQHDPFMEEHVEVLDAVITGKAQPAMKALERHLRSSFPKVADRLEAFRASYTPPPLTYLN